MNNFLLPPGFKDEIHEKAFLEHKYKNKIIELFQSNGYALVKPPLVEYLNDYNKKNVFLINNENDEANESYILRNDITLQISRLASSRLNHKNRPLKLCYYGEVVRSQGTMLRPERQFLQVGAECIGEKSILADVEILDIAYQALSLVGIKQISIELSSSEFLSFLLNKITKKEDRNKIFIFLRRKDYNNCFKYLDSSLHEFTKQILSCTGKLDEKKDQLMSLNFNEKTINASKQILDIYSKFKLKYPNANFFLDLSESEYLDYYTGTRFTMYANNVRGEIARGGRYMSKEVNNYESSAGFTCYMDTIIRASSFSEKVKKILIPFDILNERKQDLIKSGYIVETFFGNNSEIKEAALQKKINFCFYDNKIISIN